MPLQDIFSVGYLLYTISCAMKSSRDLEGLSRKLMKKDPNRRPSLENVVGLLRDMRRATREYVIGGDEEPKH